MMAEANLGWGAPRIHGELLKLGVEVSDRFPTDAEAIQGAIADVANLLGQSRSRFGVDRLLYRTDCETARVVCVHCFLS